MPNEDTQISVNTGSAGDTSFISAGMTGSPQDSTYADFFQETGDGNLSIGPKAQKSGLEIFTTVMSYIVPILLLLGIFGSFHVYIRGGGFDDIEKKYTFLCGYRNYGLDWKNQEDPNLSCKNFTNIKKSFDEKYKGLSEMIIKHLDEYIPIKVNRSLLENALETKFVRSAYNKKIKMNDIIMQFESVKRESLSETGDNIICNGININESGVLTTQCTIYGGALGDDDENGKLGSARIEALRFIDTLSETAKSKFILTNPPTSLSMEEVKDDNYRDFSTRTTLPLKLLYVETEKKP